ncbi:MAG: hypothetical protein IJB49_08405 [Clostridia bacterium]|nr:hypothetical protein [Clostridia bacterium]
MKRLILVILIAFLALGLLACGEKKTLHCDHCGAGVEVDADSNMEESWIIYCEACNEKLFGDNSLFTETE